MSWELHGVRRVWAWLLTFGLVVAMVPALQAAPAAAQAVTPATACPAGEVPAGDFADIGAAATRDAADCLAWYDITQGVTETTFVPTAAIQRQQLATFVVRLLGKVEGFDMPERKVGAFPDVTGGTHRQNVEILANFDPPIVGGFADGTFGPTGTVTRAQAATFMFRAYEAVRAQFPELPALPAGDPNRFTDVSGTHAAAINALAAAGIITGTSETTYSPRNLLTRGQMALLLTRLLEPLALAGVLPRPDGATGPTEVVVRGSIEQVYVYGADPDTPVTLLGPDGSAVDSDGLSWELAGRQLTAGGDRTDEKGAIAIRGTLDPETLAYSGIAPGPGYRVRYVEDGVTRTSPPVTVLSADAGSTPPQSFYDAQELDHGFNYIETRDGTLLSATVFLPNPAVYGPGPYPTLVEYSGYNLSDPTATPIEANGTTTQIAALLGYAAVAVNIRGSGCSGGAFDYFEAAQGLDGYDMIEVVAAQSWSAKVGTAGVSYPGISQLFVAATQPPSLAAAAPVAIISDHARDTVAPGGIYNTGFAREWAEERELDTRFPNGQNWVDRAVGGTHPRVLGDDIATCAENVQLRDQNMPLLDRIEVNEYESELWADRAAYDFADDLTTNLFIAVSSQDEQTGGRASALLDALDLDRDDRIVRFTGTNGTHVEALGPELLTDLVEFLELYVGERTPVLTERPDFVQMRIALSAVYAGMVGAGGPTPQQLPIPPDRFADLDHADALAEYESEPPAHIIYESGAGMEAFPGFPSPAFTHRYEWNELPHLDPDFDADANTWYLRDTGELTVEAPSAEDAEHSSYVYDPESGNQPPYSFGWNRPGNSAVWLMQPNYQWTQPPADEHLSFVTPPLQETAVTYGSASVDLWLDSDVADTDLEVMISEIRPDGLEMYVTTGWLRASKRALRDDSTELRPRPSFREEDAALLDEGWNEVRVETFPFGHAFREGSRIRLTIEAPGGNRPTWRFDETQPGGPDVRNRIAHSDTHPSKLVLPIVDVEVDVTPDVPPCADSSEGDGFTSVRGQPCRTAPQIDTGSELFSLQRTFGMPAGVELADRPNLSLEEDAPIVLIDLDTGERWPYYGELDSHPDALAAAGAELPPSPADPACESLDGAACMLPFPSDHYTAPDATTPTGLRVDLPEVGTPLNTGEAVPFAPEMDPTRIDPTEWNRNDGFSPGAMVLTYVEGRLLIVRPLVNLTPGHRYAVALRDLRTGEDEPIEAGEVFAWYRDGAEGDAPDGATGARAAQIDALLDELEGYGIDREDLYLAWDFTVASTENLTGRALSIRDEAFASLGDNDLADRVVDGDAPEVTITNVSTPGGATQRRVEGRVRVPNFLHLQPGDPTPTLQPDGTWHAETVIATTAARFAYDTADPGPMDLPIRNTTADLSVLFSCNISSAATAEDPSTPMLYGHGLMGSHTEVNGGSSNQLRLRNFTACAVDWAGMSSADMISVSRILQDGSRFARLPDRLQQGYLHFMFLGRALIHPDGLRTMEEFQDDEGAPLIADDTLAYDGNSQGGILSGGLVALSPDIERGVLGVPGMNYSTLLNRSVDWEGAIYGTFYEQSYPDPIERQLGFAMLQMLWDRGEGNGYAHVATDSPLPNTPSHQILLQVAWGDYQVANIASEVQGRTYGARLLQTSLAEGRHWSDDPTFGFEVFDLEGGVPQPYEGSALVYFDSGNRVPPSVNIPPAVVQGEGDPHSDPRHDVLGSDQRAIFLRTGIVTDPHEGQPYWTQNCRGVGVNPNC